MTFEVARHSFDLSPNFIAKFVGKEPEWGPLGLITYKRTYARPVCGGCRGYRFELKERPKSSIVWMSGDSPTKIPEVPEQVEICTACGIEYDGSTEEYWETCRRVVEGTFSIQKNHCKANRLPWDNSKAQKSAQRMFVLMWEFKYLPPGRGLWAMGTDHVIRHGGAALNNCGFVSTKDIGNGDVSKPFCFLMDMSMVGVGIGFDVNGAGKCHIYKPFATESEVDPFQIPDSREGWVDSLKQLIESYAKPDQPSVWFDYSAIRPKGSPIRGFGGKSSGPEPLIALHADVRAILDSRVGSTLSSSDITDIMNMIGRCVVAGNVRRSAEIAFGSPYDAEFLALKQDKEKLLSHRWASNNSIFAEVGMSYDIVANHTAINGEPGYLWLENARAYGRMKDPPNHADQEAVGANPCNEQTLFNYELCCLAEIFIARHENFLEFQETSKMAYLYAKTVTLVPTTWEETNAVIMRNRRIGLSQSGIIRAFEKHGRRTILQWSDNGYKFVDALDIIYSNWLGIPRSIKKTSVKPSGTISLLPGEPPGIHYPHSQYYIRRIRVAKNSPFVQAAIDAGLRVEDDKYSDTSACIEFIVKELNFTRSKDDVSIWEQVANAAAYQKYWADNQVSITVTFRPDEANDIKHVLEMFEDSLKGISFLPSTDHGYVQAPYETIDEAEYLRRTKDLKPFVLQKNAVTEHNRDAVKFCDGDTCQV